MKSILLASASVLAFAGAAAAEVSFTGDATLGYNDTNKVVLDDDGFDIADDDFGFYWDANLAVTASQELDNGITAAATFNFDFADDDTDINLAGGDYLLSVTADMGGLYFGETSFAAETYWQSAGDMEADRFSEADGETVLRGELLYSGITAGVSYVVADADNHMVREDTTLHNDAVDQLSLGVNGEFGMFQFAAAYQEESIILDLPAGVDPGFYDPAGANGDFVLNEVYGVSVGTTFAGATIRVAYAADQTTDESSTGVQVSYPFGPITATAYYVMEDDNDNDNDNYGATIVYTSGPLAVSLDYDNDQSTDKTTLNGSYDLGNGLTVIAGYYAQEGVEDDEYYAGATFDLGNGAEILAVYARSSEADADDEVGPGDYEEGITLEASFNF